MNRRQEPTCTSLVQEVLVKTDDFKTPKQLCEETRLTPNQVCAALHHLHRHKAVDFITDVNGTFWFTTLDEDNRCKCVDLRAPEVKPRRPRKTKKGGVT